MDDTLPKEQLLDRVMGPRSLASWVLGLFFLPVLVDLLLSKRERLLDYFAADAFYYLTVARNTVEHGLVSFDQTYLTNGYHPLWQFLLSFLYGVAHFLGVSPIGFLWWTLVVSMFMLGGGLVFLLRSMLRTGRKRLSAAVLLLPVGSYALVMSPFWFGLDATARARQSGSEGFPPLYGTMWSYANGMESAVLILAFGAACYWYVAKGIEGSLRNAGVLGALLALVALARLDHVFFPLCVLGCLSFWALLARRARKEVLVAWAVFLVMFLGYMLLNKIFFGSAVPISGKLKTEFPYWTNEHLHTIKLLFKRVEENKKFLPILFRLTQMLLPMLVAVVFFVFAIRIKPGVDGWRVGLRRNDRYEHMLVFTGLFVVALGMYNLLFVRPGSQGHWYFPVSVLFVTLVTIRAFEFLATLLRNRKWWEPGVALACVTMTLLIFTTLHRPENYHTSFAEFLYVVAPDARKELAGKSVKLLSLDDGIVAYGLGLPSMSGTGLAGDAPTAKARKERRIGDFAISRGYTHFTSLSYYNSASLSKATSAAMGRWLAGRFQIKDANAYEYRHAYHYKGLFGIIEVIAKPEKK